MDILIGQFKKGYRTSEFWVALITGLVVIANVFLPDDYQLDTESLVAAAGAASAYILSRGYLKNGRAQALGMSAPINLPDPPAEVPYENPPVPDVEVNGLIDSNPHMGGV